jgi:hypothetical protein
MWKFFLWLYRKVITCLCKPNYCWEWWMKACRSYLSVWIGTAILLDFHLLIDKLSELGATSWARCHEALFGCNPGQLIEQSGPELNTQCTLKRNIETHSRNHCCRGKTISITYFVCVRVCVALVVQHAKHMCCVVTCGLSGLTIIFHVIKYGTIFGAKSYWT